MIDEFCIVHIFGSLTQILELEKRHQKAVRSDAIIEWL